MNHINNAKIFIIEGLWKAGKSHLCHYLQNEYNFYYIKEPNHIKSGLANKTPKATTAWYLKQHIKNLNLGIKLTKQRFNVVIERSPISSLVFIKTFHKNCRNYNENILHFEKILVKNKEIITFIYLKPKNLKKLAESIKKEVFIMKYAKINILKKMNSCFLKYFNKLSSRHLGKSIILESQQKYLHLSRSLVE